MQQMEGKSASPTITEMQTLRRNLVSRTAKVAARENGPQAPMASPRVGTQKS